MATQKSGSSVPVRRESSPQQQLSRAGWDPLDMMRRLIDDLDGGFFGAPWTMPLGSMGMRRSAGWRPQIETFQRGDQYVVRADLPGLKKNDVTVEVREDALVISGERTHEQQHDEEGYFATERSYGQFYRVLPLPEGAITDDVTATFENGVLEVVVQAPPAEASRGRKVAISEKRST